MQSCLPCVRGGGERRRAGGVVAEKPYEFALVLGEFETFYRTIPLLRAKSRLTPVALRMMPAGIKSALRLTAEGELPQRGKRGHPGVPFTQGSLWFLSIFEVI